MASASVPFVEAAVTELLAGKTVSEFHTGSAIPQNPTNANDRDHLTKSVLQAGFAAGTIVWGWKTDLTSAQTVTRMRVWDPSGSDYWDYPTGALVQYSSDNSTWTTAAHTYSSATVSTGLAFPYATTTTEYRYELVTPISRRYWRIYQTAGGGLFSGRGMSEWFIDGTTTAGSDVVWGDAPDTIDGNDATSDDVDEAAITETAGPFWRYDAGEAVSVDAITAILGFADTGSVTINVQAGEQADYSDAATVIVLNGTATGSLTDDEYDSVFDPIGPYQYWQLVLDSAEQDVRVYEVELSVYVAPPDTVPPDQQPGKAILEIYVHDEDAARWDIALWDEDVWSTAGWVDISPQGVRAHVIWGSRRPDRGILAPQDGASWNVEYYDPDRVLDPGNFDSPYYPQLLPGVPIRVNHDALTIRTGYIDEMSYNHKRPDYQGQILGTDTIALLNQAKVPDDAVLGDTLLERVQDAINAAEIAVGGIPLPPGGPAGPAIAPLDPDNPRERSVWDHVRLAAEEVLWVVYVDAAGGLGMRSWGAPLDRSREITDENLEDLSAKVSEDGMYSVARVQGDDPDVPPIEREAAPLPRYGRRVIERTELTVDPEGWATAVLADRAWAGVQYIPGTIHCFTRSDVDYFGSLEIMERVTITLPGDVSVTGRILGGELYVEHKKDSTRGATWQFIFQVATDGSSAVGITTLVADGTGDTLVDDDTGDDYLEAD